MHLTTNEDGETEAGVAIGDDEPSAIVQLSNRVQDGTRCRMGSLDMCIQGKCQVNLFVLAMFSMKCSMLEMEYIMYVHYGCVLLREKGGGEEQEEVF